MTNVTVSVYARQVGVTTRQEFALSVKLGSLE